MPQLHLFLLLLSAVLFLLATLTAWPRTTPLWGGAAALGWAGAFCFVVAAIVP